MNLSEAREHYYTHSGLASTSARQLAFAGIAVVWILATQNGVISVDAKLLRAPLLAFVVTLAFDLLQYYGLAFFWGAFGWLKERRDETEFEGAPGWGNWMGICCFWIKGVAVAIGYFYLLRMLWPILLK